MVRPTCSKVFIMPEAARPTWRYALPATALLLSGILSGCAGSGFYAYLGDTFTPPFGSNPNVAQPSSSTDGQPSNETYSKIRARNVEQPKIILYEAGDVWPPPPKAPPTLKDLQNQQNQEMSNGSTGSPNYAPLQPLPQLPGFEVPDQQVHAPSPTTSFPGGVVHLPSGRQGVITGGGADLKSLNGPTGNGSIVVPNGNGTSTVIGPNGTVSTIPSPGK